MLHMAPKNNFVTSDDVYSSGTSSANNILRGIFHSVNCHWALIINSIENQNSIFIMLMYDDEDVLNHFIFLKPAPP